MLADRVVLSAGKLTDRVEAVLADAAFTRLTATTAQVVIVHWNRLGLSARTQGVLAHAAIAAALPRSVR